MVASPDGQQLVVCWICTKARRVAYWQVNYSKYVEPYVNKIPRGSTSTSGPAKPAAFESTAESVHVPPMPSMHTTPVVAMPVTAEPKKVI